MYGKINKIANIVKGVKGDYTRSGRLVTIGYKHSITTDGVEVQIKELLGAIKKYDDEISKITATQKYLMTIGEIEDSLECQYSISSVQRKKAKTQKELVGLQKMYRDILATNEIIKREIG